MGGILLYGGGLDSTALLIHLASRGRPLIVLHFNYGQVAYKLEQEAAKFFCDRYTMSYDTVDIDLKSLAPGASIVGGSGADMMDGRNAVLIMAGAMYASTCDFATVYLGYHREPPDHPFPDATQEALDAAQVAVNAMFKKPARIRAPFIEMERLEIVRRAYARESLFFSHTHTCYRDVRGGCGMCKHCEQKRGYMQAVGA